MLSKIGKHLSVVLLIGIFSFRPPGEVIKFSTNDLNFTMNNVGQITAIISKSTGKNYLPSNTVAPLISLYKDSVYATPETCTYNKSSGQLTLKFSGGQVAKVAVVQKNGYLRFRLESLEPRNGTEAVVWGPYPTIIQESIGETVCVVHDQDFAIGMQALDINTIEGLPDGNDNAFGGSFIDPLPGQVLPDSLKDKIGMPVEVNVNITGDMPAYVRMYRGTAAVKKHYGSELRLFSRDRRIPRVVENGFASSKGVNKQYVSPVDVDFAGSSIAFFGCPSGKVLSLIGEIETAEKLPHPLLDGQWVKTSRVPGQAYLMFEGKDMNKGAAYAQAGGFKLIHAGDLFKSWGHFDLHTDRYPGGAADIKKVTDESWRKNIALGVHTLTMFTGTNDAYVTPVPSDSLAKAGSASLANSIDEQATDIAIDDPLYFRNTWGTHTVKIGKELINYKTVSDGQPWRLTGCRRGQFGTSKSAHKAGDKVDKLMNNDYQGFYPDIYLQDEFSKRLAAVCNETGLGLMDFDGFGGESPTGHGTYGAARFVDTWYRNLDKYVLTCGAGTFHYYWHIYSFMNWGEPWYNALRQSQVNYRIENQRYFKRNYMPHMLGWFSCGTDYRPEEIEWIQARSAAFDAGYLLRMDESIETNGFKEELFSLVKDWQEARNSHSFTTEQLKAFEDPSSEFHLQRVGDKKWQLYPVKLQPGYEHKFRHVQTGEPVASHFKTDNPYQAQPFQLYIIATATEGNKASTVSALEIEVNQYQSIRIDEPLKAGDRIIIDGKAVWLCDNTWNKLKKLEIGSLPNWDKGTNELTVKSEFSGDQAPVLKFDCKFTGMPQDVSAK